jgi:MFS family permease
MANDRHEDALKVMAEYHGEGDRNSPIVQLEYREMQTEISLTGADKRWWDYRGLFNSRESRYRTALTVGISFFGQWAGNGAVSYYYPQMLAGAGITDAHLVLLLQGINAVVSFIGALGGAYFTDKWGRRPQLLGSTAAMVLLFSIITALNATNLGTSAKGTLVALNPSQAKAEVAMIFIFAFVFAVGWTPLQGLYCVEVLAYENRAKGMAFHTFWTNIAGFYNTFVTGIAFTDA